MSSIPSNTDDIRAPLLDTSHVPSHSSSSSSSSSASSSLSHSTSSHQFPTSATSTPLTTSTSTSISTSTPISHPVIRSQSATFYDHKDDGIGTGIGSVSTGDIKQVETIQQEENIPYYQRHYERIIQKLKAERELELKKKNEKKVLYTTSQQRWILSVGCLVVSLLITMLVFLFYPRLPTWDIPSMSVVEYRPSVDGSTAFFHISLSASVYNHNFLTMGIESMEIIFFHNTTYLGHTDAGAVRFGSRSSSHLTLDGNFHRLPPEKYGPIGAELAANNGVMSLIMEARVKTNEVFRLTDLQVTCSLLTWINQTESAGPAHIRSCDCSHTVRSRSNHQRRTAAP